jgi:hypothetical protein
VWADQSGASLSIAACPERRIRVSYVVEYLTPYGDFAGAGLQHKVVLASDDEFTDWPSGLGFSFGSGTVKQLVLFKNYDYGNPVAFVYRHNAANVCSAEALNNCLPFQNKDIAGGRTYAGNYSIVIDAIVDTRTSLMRPAGFSVHLNNATFDGQIFTVNETELASVNTTSAARWLSPNAKSARVYFMTRRTHVVLRQFGVTVTDSCADATTAAAPITLPATETSAATTATEEATTTATTGSGTLAETVSTKATEYNSNSNSSSSDTVVVPVTIPEAMGSGENVTIYMIGGAVGILLCIVLVTCLYVCRRRLYKSRCVLCCYRNLPCRRLFCCCCADKLNDELSSFGSDDPMMAEIKRAEGVPEQFVQEEQYEPQHKPVARKVSANYDFVHLPPADMPTTTTQRSTAEMEYGNLPKMHFVPGQGMVESGGGRPMQSQQHEPVAVVAVDPPSPYDRVTMMWNRLTGSSGANQSRPRPGRVPMPSDDNYDTVKKPKRPAPLYDQFIPPGGADKVSGEEEISHEFGFGIDLNDVSTSTDAAGAAASGSDSKGGLVKRNKQYDQVGDKMKE